MTRERTGRPRAALTLPPGLAPGALLLALAPLAAGQTAPAPAASDPKPAGPWRLSKAIGAPDWFQIKGTIRTRYESFDEQFRAIGGGEEHGLFTRSLVEMTVRDQFLSATVELQDSRVYSGVTDATLNTTIGNAVEFLQAYVAGEFTDFIEPDDRLRVQLGRHTMDVGSRRLVARNRFRNTINAFTGANAQWESKSSGTKVRAFYTFPVQRLPRDQDGLDDNEIRNDEERTSVRFWGAHAEVPDVAGMSAEFYFFGLDESDATDLNTADRDLNTIGTRWVRPHKAGEFFGEAEAVFQFGERGTRDHEAAFYHASVGYQFEDEFKSRVEGLFDYASGDDDPNDDESGRFDTLFGARRWEFGPTGILGVIARANVLTPGVRFTTRPSERMEFMLTHRLVYLASDRDAWTTSGLVDPSGAAGSDVGNFTEFRIRYNVVPKSFLLDFGAAYLAAGDFIDDAPNATTQGDTLYGYVQTVFTF